MSFQLKLKNFLFDILICLGNRMKFEKLWNYFHYSIKDKNKLI